LKATNSYITSRRLVPIDDPDSAVGAGWFVEIDGRRVAELTEPMYESGSQFWISYVIVPTTNDPEEKSALLSGEFWSSGKAVFRSRKFGVVAPNAFPSTAPPEPDTHRMQFRGLYVQLDRGPSLIEMLVKFFKRWK
jgi:hypothetical protein